MRVEIFDVGHGQCAVLTSPNGRRMMIDCGVRIRDGRFWAPSLHFFRERLEVLALLNLDEDHIRDFGFMLRSTTIDQIVSNPTIGARELRVLKEDGMGPGTEAVAHWMVNYRGASVPLLDFSPMTVRWYYNSFIPKIATDANDLSLVIFVEFGRFKIVFSGDIEKAGWRQLLLNPDFRRDLIGTTIFVASHHGRKNGQCAELFDRLRPELIIISDDEKKYGSQETTDWYAERCTGAIVVADPRQRRYVMTTRKDGSMQIDVTPEGLWFLQPIEVQDWPLSSPPTSRPAVGLGLASGFGLGFSSESKGIGLGLANPFLSAVRR